MGKNYTLYINQEGFAGEANKSGLVNELLFQHYSGEAIDAIPRAAVKVPDAILKATRLGPKYKAPEKTQFYSPPREIVDDTVYVAEAKNADNPKLTNYSKPTEVPMDTIETVKQLFGDAHIVDFCSHGADRKMCRLATVKNGVKLCRSK